MAPMGQMGQMGQMGPMGTSDIGHRTTRFSGVFPAEARPPPDVLIRDVLIRADLTSRLEMRVKGGKYRG